MDRISRRSTPTRPMAAASSNAATSTTGSRPLFTALLFLHDVNRNLHRDVAMKFDGHLEIAQRLDGLLQINLSAIDRVSLFLERRGDISNGYRAEQLVRIAG